jgi:hypothetical protein
MCSAAVAVARPVDDDAAKKKGALKPVTPPELLDAMKNTVKALREYDDRHGMWFKAPVTDDVAPGYSTAIKKPMDLSTITKNLKLNTKKVRGSVFRRCARSVVTVCLSLSSCISSRWC